MRVFIREDLGTAFPGTVRAGRSGLRWHRTWSLPERRIRWSQVRSCTVAPDRRPGVLRHTIRLVVEFDDGLLEMMLRGPLGALALAELRDTIRVAADLPHA